MYKKIGVVITGGDFQALGAIRTLGRKGIPVTVLDKDLCISKYSKFVKKCIKAPSLSDENTYKDFLIHIAEKENIKGSVLFPNSDEAVCIISKHKKILEKYYSIPTPTWDVIKNVYIKKNTYRIAGENGIPVPKTYSPESIERLIDLDLDFPLVIKPSIRDYFYNKTKIKAFRINTKEELIKTYKFVSEIIDPSEILIQEFIAGGPKHLYSFCPFFKDGEIITSIMARRSRQHPMDFGHASTYAELVDIAEMREHAEKFLNLIGYYGIGEVEFMYDPKDGSYKLIELNPRIWGWHSLAIAAGVDLPYLLYKDVTGEKIEPPTKLRNVKWVRLVTDLPTVITEILKGKMKLSDYINSMKGEKEFAVFCKNDPIPFFVEIAMIPYLWIKRGF